MNEKLNLIQENKPWYAQGLKFECTGCGKCCTGSPGYVFLSQEEMEEIASYLNLTLSVFTSQYIRKVNGQFCLIEMAKTYDCIFLKEQKCSIYEKRPKQCRTFPFWTHLLTSKKEWEKAASYCEGIQENAAVVPLEKIENQLAIFKEFVPTPN